MVRKKVYDLIDPKLVDQFTTNGGDRQKLDRVLKFLFSKFNGSHNLDGIYFTPTDYSIKITQYFLGSTANSLELFGHTLKSNSQTMYPETKYWILNANNIPTNCDQIFIFDDKNLLKYRKTEGTRATGLVHLTMEKFFEFASRQEEFKKFAQGLSFKIVPENSVQLRDYTGGYNLNEILLKPTSIVIYNILITAHEYAHHRFQNLQKSSIEVRKRKKINDFRDTIYSLFSSCFTGRAIRMLQQDNQKIEFPDFPTDYAAVNINEFHSEIFAYTFTGQLLAEHIKNNNLYELDLTHSTIPKEYLWIFRQPKDFQKNVAELCGFDYELIAEQTTFLKNNHPELLTLEAPIQQLMSEIYLISESLGPCPELSMKIEEVKRHPNLTKDLLDPYIEEAQKHGATTTYNVLADINRSLGSTVNVIRHYSSPTCPQQIA